ncbi:hypothetical protein GLU60_01305 [Nanohaloarchaea archaeon H01]|nr:hypothetical protein [Nanohaloarchaea archaeon H01]
MTHKSHALGEINGNRYVVVVRPYYELVNVKEIEDWCITLFCRNTETLEQEEVVTIDTAHDYVHIDLKFVDHPFKSDKVPKEHLDFWSAYRKVVDNWEEFASKHERNR